MGPDCRPERGERGGGRALGCALGRGEGTGPRGTRPLRDGGGEKATGPRPIGPSGREQVSLSLSLFFLIFFSVFIFPKVFQ